MFCDTTLQFGHLGHTEIFEKDFVEAYAELQKQEQKQ
jgi:hypothetical protein